MVGRGESRWRVVLPGCEMTRTQSEVRPSFVRSTRYRYCRRRISNGWCSDTCSLSSLRSQCVVGGRDGAPGEAEGRAGVAVAGVVLEIDDLLDCPAVVDAERLQRELRDGHAVDEQ